MCSEVLDFALLNFSVHSRTGCRLALRGVAADAQDTQVEFHITFSCCEAACVGLVVGLVIGDEQYPHAVFAAVGSWENVDGWQAGFPEYIRMGGQLEGPVICRRRRWFAVCSWAWI